MSDLADFLLARIAEEEAMYRSHASKAREDGIFWAPVPGIGQEVGYRPAFHLAECEAKQRIVEEMAHEVDQEQADEWFAIADRVTWMKPAQLWLYTLQCLALPYADHPDYREEWRA